MQTLKIKNQEIPFTINHSTKAKNIGLAVSNKGLKLTIPVKAKGYNIEQIINEKSDWILKHYQRIQEAKATENKEEKGVFESFMYLGEECRVELHSHNEKRIILKFSEKVFHIWLPPTDDVKEKNNHIKQVIKAWYKKVAVDNIKTTVDKYANIMELKYNVIKVKDQKTRWGSCSKKGNLNFSWRLIMAPQWIIDYVVIHELSHLRHMDHSKDFWKHVEKYMPDYKKTKVWFNENGVRLSSVFE